MNIKKVKVYATLGPACEDPKTLKLMFQEGMDGARLNLSHTTLDDASNLVEVFHQAAREYGIKPELLIDMQGPELRIGRLKKSVCLNEGDSIDPADLAFPEAVKETLSERPSGQEILLDDGKILLKTKGLTPDGGVCLRRKSGACYPLFVKDSTGGGRVHSEVSG